MDRRSFLTSAGVGFGSAAAAVAGPAAAQSLPEIRWRCASSFPKSLDTIFGATELISRRVAEATEGRFTIRVFAGGEIVPGLQVLDAVQANTVECGHTASYYYVGKDPTFAFDTAMPFGFNCRQQNAWMYAGGGLELMREFFGDYGVVPFPAGNSGCQMGGWFRREITGVEDLQGLKFRIGGYAGQVLSRLGVVPQQIPAGDVYQALERGAIDAAEWVGPYDDEKLQFDRVAKYYYYPGWWDGGPQLTMIVNRDQWESLPKPYQAAFTAACAEANLMMVAKYDAENPPALARLMQSGAILRPFPQDVMEACYRTTFTLFEEEAARNPRFRKVYEPWLQFRDMVYRWFGVAEVRFDSFVLQRMFRKS